VGTVGCRRHRSGRCGLLHLALLASKPRQNHSLTAGARPHSGQTETCRSFELNRPTQEFCIVVSDTLRWYLEERFNFHAPERTTEEFLHELRGTTLLTPDQKENLEDFLNRCDLVKFAKYEPREPELRDLHASAVRLVEETEPVLTPGAVEGSATTTEAGSPPLVAK